MDKIETMSTHSLTLSERKSIIITGVKKISSFDNKDFLLETTMGFMTIKGNDLEIVKLDTYQGNVSIKGMVDSIVYSETSKKEKQESIISKLFK